MTSHAARAVVLKPGDTLLIGNVGSLGDWDDMALSQAITGLSQTLGLGKVFVFEHDIDVAALAPVAPLPDAVVLRVFDREAVAQHREVLAAWLECNGIDPKTVDAEWLSIEQADGLRLIRYRAFRQTEDGHRMVDPADQNHAWTIERVSPLVIDLDLPTGQTVTEGDENP